MFLSNVTFRGPKIDDESLFDELPENLAALLRSINGFILCGGGLHIRGACVEPEWHSLRAAWHGQEAIQTLYDSVGPLDIPFAQDCVGDQFLLRGGKVLALSAETGEIGEKAIGLASFLQAANSDPEGFLAMEPLLALQGQGEILAPGQLIQAYPPFCTQQAAQGVSLKAVRACEVIGFHAELASKMPKDGGQFEVVVVD
jgi:hypothetical protein